MTAMKRWVEATDGCCPYLGTYEGAAKGAIETDVTGRVGSIRAALVWIEARGWIEIREEGSARRHYLSPAE